MCSRLQKLYIKEYQNDGQLVPLEIHIAIPQVAWLTLLYHLALYALQTAQGSVIYSFQFSACDTLWPDGDGFLGR